MLPTVGRRSIQLPRLAEEAAVVGLVTLLQVGGTFAASRHQNLTPARSLDVVGVMLLVAPALLLFGRRRAPEVVLTAVFALTLLYDVLGYPKGPIFFALIVAFYTTIMYGRRWYALTILGLGYVGFVWVVHYVGHDHAPSLAQVAGVGGWLLVLWFATEMIRATRAHAAERRRSAEEAGRRLATDERLRIAREIHDVVAHNISMINVQAGVGLHLMDDDPEQAASALAAIKNASRETLQELRSVLGVLRDVDGNGAAPRAPTAGLERVGDLVENARRAGLVVRLDISGAPRPVRTETDLAAYRILQESITNVVRHADAHVVRCDVVYERDGLRVVVDDDGRGTSMSALGESGGTGIAGMRERAAARGGSLSVSESARGGVRVEAWLPLRNHS
jgi:signal transduction histidine kinase